MHCFIKAYNIVPTTADEGVLKVIVCDRKEAEKRFELRCTGGKTVGTVGGRFGRRITPRRGETKTETEREFNQQRDTLIFRLSVSH